MQRQSAPPADDSTSPEEVTGTPTASHDVRLDLIEQGRTEPLTPERRAAVVERLRATDTGWVEWRAYQVPDGTEPANVFTPASPRRPAAEPAHD